MKFKKFMLKQIKKKKEAENILNIHITMNGEKKN